jgi:hypothetical protein
LPEDLVDGVLRVCVVNPVLGRGDGMKHDAMGNVFSQRPRHDAATEENSGNGRFESRADEQCDCDGGREDQLAEVNSDRLFRNQTHGLVPEPLSIYPSAHFIRSQDWQRRPNCRSDFLAGHPHCGERLIQRNRGVAFFRTQLVGSMMTSASRSADYPKR